MLDLEAIKDILPHRYPFLLIDRVMELETGKYCKALKNVTANESLFQGHFPQQAVFPGVLMVEAMAQTAGIVIHSSKQKVDEESLFFFAGINNAKFRAPVVPGDQLILETTLSNQRRNFWVFEGRASVGDKLVAQAEVRLMQ